MARERVRIVMSPSYQPMKPLVQGVSASTCSAVVVLPARNEEGNLAAALSALAGQLNADGAPLDPGHFEVIVLLNNCTDRSAQVVREWSREHPATVLHAVERVLSDESAHVGVARRLLMDTAWIRLRKNRDRCAAILSTDADTQVAPDWLIETQKALRRGADAVAGAIEMHAGEFAALPSGVQLGYERDRRYGQLVARLEDLLDPQEGDAWPRHLQHFGASLACTTEAYARCGGLPPVKPLEDVALVDALRRVDACVRHEPRVRVITSARMDGRSEIGLSGQLRLWQQAAYRGEPHTVLTAGFLMHRFRTLARLRALWRKEKDSLLVAGSATDHCDLHHKACHRGLGEFLAQMDCDSLVEETFLGERLGEVDQVNRELAAAIAHLRAHTKAQGKTGNLRANRSSQPNAPAGPGDRYRDVCA